MGRWTQSTILLSFALAMTMPGGCSSQRPAPERDPRAKRLAELDAMGRRCGYPRSEWKLVGTEELHLQPNPNERYEVVVCMLREIKKSDIPFNMGFVGNEAYEPGNRQ